MRRKEIELSLHPHVISNGLLELCVYTVHYTHPSIGAHRNCLPFDHSPRRTRILKDMHYYEEIYYILVYIGIYIIYPCRKYSVNILYL